MKLLLIYVLIINLTAFFMYAIDKYKAIKSQWRISEAALLMIACLGGSIGSLVGIYLCRHKTKHLKFTLGIPLILLIQIALIVFITQGTL